MLSDKLKNCDQLAILSPYSTSRNFFLYHINLKIKELNIFTLSWLILALRLKIKTFSNSMFPGMFQNDLSFIPRWSEVQLKVENILPGFFLTTLRYFKDVFWDTIITNCLGSGQGKHMLYFVCMSVGLL